MPSLRSAIIALFLAGVASSGNLAAGAFARSGSASGRWTISHWSKPAGYGGLAGVAAISSNDVWSVGSLGRSA